MSNQTTQWTEIYCCQSCKRQAIWKFRVITSHNHRYYYYCAIVDDYGEKDKAQLNKFQVNSIERLDHLAMVVVVVVLMMIMAWPVETAVGLMMELFSLVDQTRMREALLLQ